MIKKEYKKPTLKEVLLQHQSPILTVSYTSTSGLDSSDDLEYDFNGGNQEEAW